MTKKVQKRRGRLQNSSLLSNPLPSKFFRLCLPKYVLVQKKDSITSKNFENRPFSDKLATLPLLHKTGSWMKLTDSNLVLDYVGNIFFEIQKRVKHLKWNKTLRKHGAFGFAFGIQLGLWQKRALILSKTKNDPKTLVENLESDLYYDWNPKEMWEHKP